MASASSSASSQLHWALDGAGEQAKDNLAPVERRMLNTGKKEHRETTEATQRTLQVRKKKDLSCVASRAPENLLFTQTLFRLPSKQWKWLPQQCWK